MCSMGLLEYVFTLKWQHLVRKDGLKINLIFWYVACSRCSSRVKSTSKMVFNMAAMRYPQINTTFSLKWLMMHLYYDLLINYTEFDLVLYGIGMPFSKLPSFSNMAIIIHTYVDSISVFSFQSKKKEERYKS